MPIDKKPLTDDDAMPWGRHMGTNMKDVPPGYLLWLYEQPWIKDWPDVFAYLKKNEDVLIAERSENTDDEAGGFVSYDDFRESFRGF